MRDPKRILGKLLGNGADLAGYEATGEPMETTIEVLREVVKCRRTRQWLLDSFGFDLALDPAVFFELLDIPKINFIETSNRMLDVETVSLKESRAADAPVSIGNLNSVLQEFSRSLHEIAETGKKDYPHLLLEKEMHADLVDRVGEWCRSLHALKGRLTGYLLSGPRAKRIEKEFREMFPRSARAHPLRLHIAEVERELEFYRKCLETNRKWQAIDLDLFRVLREDGLARVLENVEELGSLLWNIVYKYPQVQQSLALAGMGLGDIRALFDANLAPVNNF